MKTLSSFSSYALTEDQQKMATGGQDITIIIGHDNTVIHTSSGGTSGGIGSTLIDMAMAYLKK